MDCEKIKQIYRRSCEYNYSKSLSTSYYFSEVYYANDIQTRADANCMKAIQLYKNLKCNEYDNSFSVSFSYQNDKQ